MVGSFLAYLTVNNFGRVKVLVWCHAAMTILHFSLAFCILYEQNFLAVINIIVFILVFHLGEGSIVWIYSAEICQDAAFGFAVFGQFFNLIILSMTTEYLIAYLKPHGTFFLFGGITLTGGICIWLLAKETKGLTD